MNPRVYLLALGTFTVGTEGYVIAGVLPALAHDLRTTISIAGQLVTVFAVFYALAGPVIIGFFQHVPLRTVLTISALVFAFSNGIAALSTNFTEITLARILAAVSAALFVAPAAATAAILCKPEQLPHAISVTAGGNALALTFGAPLGTIISTYYGWRGAFWFITILALIVAVCIRWGLPVIPVNPNSSKGRLNLLQKPSIRWGISTTFLLFLSAYIVYTYLAPISYQAAGFGSHGVAGTMIVFGAGGFITGRLIGKILTKQSLKRVLITVLSAMTLLFILLAILTYQSSLTKITHYIYFPLFFIMGAAWWSGGISQQTRIASHAPEQRSQALGLHFSAQYLGVALGGALGGILLAQFGAVSIPIAAASIAALALFTLREVSVSRVNHVGRVDFLVRED